MLALGTEFLTVCLLLAGLIPYKMWTSSRGPSREARWTVIGLWAAAIGYAGAVAYGFAFTDPVSVCGWRTLDNDFPLLHVTVDPFPPDVACHWSDLTLHPTAMSTWVMWAGLGVTVVALSVVLLRRESRVSPEVRAGAIWSPMVAAGIWVAGIDPALDLPRSELDAQCLYAKPVPPETVLTWIKVLDVDRTVFPPSITCTYPDGTTNLLAGQWIAVLVCAAVSAAFAGVVLHQVRRAGPRGREVEEPAD
ncbi:hypothetical protein ABT373_14405 [Streptomyces sp. NPDC000070]|uniref:hypothetical protein n=1 Tax=Streptomyces sp. NPDC000070 TaxID=3154240 RepID=UPI00332BCD62